MAGYKVSFSGLDDLMKSVKNAAKLDDVKTIVKNDTALLQRTAQQNTPVDTGNLKRSETISIEDGGMTGKVTAHTDYAPYQEYGTRWIYGKFYMKKAADTAGRKFLSDMERLVK